MKPEPISKLLERMQLPDLKAAVVSAVQTEEDPEKLVRAYNALHRFEIEDIEKLLEQKLSNKKLLKEVAYRLYNGKPPVENSAFISALEGIFKYGALPVPEIMKNLDYVQSSRESAPGIASQPDVIADSDEVLAVINFILKDFLMYQQPQGGTAVGAGELAFALLMKGGSKLGIGDLDIQGKHVEVKGRQAWLQGQANQGGFKYRGSTYAAKVLTPYIEERAPNLVGTLVPRDFNFNTKNGPRALVEAMTLVEDLEGLVQGYVDILCDWPVNPPENSSFKQPMVRAILEEDWYEMVKNYFMFHYEAYQSAAGWEYLLLFSNTVNPSKIPGVTHDQLILLKTPEDAGKAFEDGKIDLRGSGVSFSPGKDQSKIGADVRSGFSLSLRAEGSESPPDQSPEGKILSQAREIEKLEKALQKVQDRLVGAKESFDSKKAQIDSSQLTPSKEKKALQVLTNYKNALEKIIAERDQLQAEINQKKVELQ